MSRVEERRGGAVARSSLGLLVAVVRRASISLISIQHLPEKDRNWGSSVQAAIREAKGRERTDLNIPSPLQRHSPSSFNAACDGGRRLTIVAEFEQFLASRGRDEP